MIPKFSHPQEHWLLKGKCETIVTGDEEDMETNQVSINEKLAK